MKVNCCAGSKNSHSHCEQRNKIPTCPVFVAHGDGLRSGLHPSLDCLQSLVHNYGAQPENRGVKPASAAQPSLAVLWNPFINDILGHNAPRRHFAAPRAPSNAVAEQARLRYRKLIVEPVPNTVVARLTAQIIFHNAGVMKHDLTVMVCTKEPESDRGFPLFASFTSRGLGKLKRF